MSSCMVKRSSSWFGESFDPLRFSGTTLLWSSIPHFMSDKSRVVLGKVQFCTFKLWVCIGKAWLEVVIMLFGCNVICVMVCPGMFCPETNKFDIPVTWLVCWMLCHIGFCCCWVCVVYGWVFWFMKLDGALVKVFTVLVTRFCRELVTVFCIWEYGRLVWFLWFDGVKDCVELWTRPKGGVGVWTPRFGSKSFSSVPFSLHSL